MVNVNQKLFDFQTVE